MNNNDPVNNPGHYTNHPSGIECIQITEHMGFNLGNALKYIWRCDLKIDDIKDLTKARWYINREITKRDEEKVSIYNKGTNIKQSAYSNLSYDEKVEMAQMTDYAIVSYLERAKGLSRNKIKEEILNDAEASSQVAMMEDGSGGWFYGVKNYDEFL